MMFKYESSFIFTGYSSSSRAEGFHLGLADDTTHSLAQGCSAALRVLHGIQP